MRWLLLNGSPRRQGNTSYVLGRVKEELIRPEDHLDEIRVQDERIAHCIDCRACKAGNLFCSVADGMQGVYAARERADTIVWAAPIYWSGVPGPMKNLIDRLRPYYKSGRLKGKKALVVTVGANADEESDLIEAMYARVCGALGMCLLGSARINGFDADDVRRSGLDPEKIAQYFREDS
jgi:multimeric flavodoxin WrbA